MPYRSRACGFAVHAATHDSVSAIEEISGAVETGSASNEVLSAAKSLANDSTRLKDEVKSFLVAVRAA